MEKMQISCLIGLLLSLVTASAGRNFMTMGPYGEISDLNIRKDLGVVKNVRSCGGSGKVLQWRYQPCLEVDPICKVPSPSDGELMTAQIDFIPSHNIEKPTLRFVLQSTVDNTSHVVDNPFFISPKEALEKGNVYTLTVTGNPEKEISGQLGIFRYIFYDRDRGQVEFCAESHFHYL